MKVEISRHLIHLAFGTILAVLFYFDILDKTQFAILLAITIAILLAYRRFKIPIIHQLMMAAERQQNLRKFPGKGALYFMLGSTLAVWLYQKDIAIASILILTWGDGIAGLARAKEKWPTKNWKSTLYAIIASTIAAQFIVNLIPAFIASTITMIAEYFVIKIDDNLYIPVLAGAVMMLVI